LGGVQFWALALSAELKNQPAARVSGYSESMAMLPLDRPGCSSYGHKSPVYSLRSMKIVKAIRRLLLVFLLSLPLLAQAPPRTVHVFVALADNINQGIVPVAKILGNGEDALHNLYRGSAYGVKTFFSRSADWQLISSGEKPKDELLERCVFKHRTANVYLIADAYRGREIQTAIQNFFDAAPE
jgi:hypothetical protein